MAFVGALRTCGAPVPLTWVLGRTLPEHYHREITSKRTGAIH